MLIGRWWRLPIGMHHRWAWHYFFISYGNDGICSLWY
jgi:hypothetical protein